SNPDAELGSSPNLYSDDKDLVMTAPDGRGRQQPIEGALLGIKRSVEECRRLTAMAAEVSAGASALALIDGSLILWGLVSKDYPEFVLEELLDRGFIKCLDEIRELNKDRKLAIASYISFPRSTDVVNTLRVAICPNEIPDCDRYCTEIANGKRECDAVAGVRDRELFYNLLADGERSALFISRSSIVEKRYGVHRIHFFYLRVGDEIARIEVPQWVVTDENILNLAHCLVLDQCRRGHGYPVALSEAHEQAVVTGADRENFQRLLEISLAEEKIPLTTSAKSLSKRTRWI
ncbi:MAG: DNA double-strand break repair nuclease NurA, partial [Dehalococcoidales bacterium]|nr:DNA double-strand break repair nuclease NurA [Dehalococcoidales bacterium]